MFGSVVSLLRGWPRNEFTSRGASEQVDLSTGQGAEFSRTQAFDRDRSDGDSGQGHHLVAELREHSAHFSVFPFGKNHLQDRRLASLTHDPHALGADFSLGEPDSRSQLVEHFLRGSSRDHDLVNLLDTELGVCQLVGEFAVVGQDHQAGARFIEPADGVH